MFAQAWFAAATSTRSLPMTTEDGGREISSPEQFTQIKAVNDKGAVPPSSAYSHIAASKVTAFPGDACVRAAVMPQGA